jgi:hypothetical protein
MNKISRRECLQAVGGTIAISIKTVSAKPPDQRPGPHRKPLAGSHEGIKLAEILNPGDEQRWRQAKQVGVNHAIASVNGVLSRIPRSGYRKALE